MSVETLRRTKRLIYSPSRASRYEDSDTSFGCRDQAKSEKMIIPYSLLEYQKLPSDSYYNSVYKIQPRDNADNVKLAVNTLNQLNFFSLVPAEDFPDEFIWKYVNDFSPRYIGPQLRFNTDNNTVKLLRQAMHLFGISEIKIGDSLNVKDTRNIFKANTTMPPMQMSSAEVDEDYSVNEELILLQNYTVLSLLSVMHEPFLNLDSIQLNTEEVNQSLDKLKFTQVEKDEFFYLLDPKNFKSKGLTPQDIVSLALRVYALAPESLVGRPFNLPNGIFIEGQYTTRRTKQAFNTVMSAAKKGQRDNYPLLARDKTLIIGVGEIVSKNLINELAVVNLSDEKIHCAFKADDFFSEKNITRFDFSELENTSESTLEKSITSSTHASKIDFLSQLTLTDDCQLNGFATSIPLELRLPIYIYDNNQQLIRYITFKIKELAKGKKIIKLAWPEVSYQNNSTLIDLASICGVVSSPDQALRCESKGIPTDWVQQNCTLNRTDFEYLRFNTTFSNNITTESCQIELISNEGTSSTTKTSEAINTAEPYRRSTPLPISMEIPLTPEIKTNDASSIRDKRSVVKPWDLIPSSFACRQQNKFKKIRIPYYYQTYVGEKISERYANTMRLAVRTLNQLNFFEIIHFLDSSNIDYLSGYDGTKIIIGSERYISNIRTNPESRRYLPPGSLCDGEPFFNKIGCRENHSDFNQLGIAALTRQLLYWFRMQDIRIGETVDYRETQGIYKPKDARVKVERIQSPFANGPIRLNAFNDYTKRNPQLLENYDVVSLFSIMHEPLTNSAHYKLDGKRISELLTPFDQSFKFDFISLIKDKNLNSRVISFLDINTLAKIIYFHAPESLLGRQFNLPDFIFIEGQYLEESLKAAFSNVISGLKKQKKFNYSLLAQNRTLVLTASKKLLNVDLITEFVVVSLSDGKISCQFGDLSFLEDQFETQSLASFNISQSDSLSESTLENIPSLAENDFEHELLKRFNLSLENCKLTGFFPESIQLTLPVLIDDSYHNLTQYITFKVKNPPVEKYLIVNKNTVRAIGNAARIDLKKLCGAVAVPDGNIVCQAYGMPRDWRQEDCWISREEERSAKFNVSFFYANKEDTCTIEIISTLPAIAKPTMATTPTPASTTRKSLLDDPRFTILVRIIHNERTIAPLSVTPLQTNPPTSTINPVDDIYNKIVEQNKLTTETLPTKTMSLESFNSVDGQFIDDLSNPITPKFGYYKKTAQEINQAKMPLIASDQRSSIHSSNSKEKSILTAICGVGITFAASLVVGIGYCWIRRFRNSRSEPQTLEAVAAVSLPLLEQATGSKGEETSDIKIIDTQKVDTNTLSSSAHKVKTPSSLNIPPKKVASLAKNDHSLFSIKKFIQGTKPSNKQPEIAFLNKPANKLENKQFFSNPPLPQPTALKSSESNISFTTWLGNNSSSYAIRYVLYSLGFKATVERMNHAQQLENINDRDQEIDKIEQRLNLALQCYK